MDRLGSFLVLMQADGVNALQYLLQLGPTGVALVVAWYFYNENVRNSNEKDAKFIDAMARFTEKFEKISDRQNATLIEMDQAQRVNSSEMNNRLIGIVGEHKANLQQVDRSVHELVGTVAELKDSVGDLKDTVREHATKIDAALGRALPSPPPTKPGKSPGGDFRPPGA